MTATLSGPRHHDPFDLRSRQRLVSTPLWIFCGQVSVVLAVGTGFGAFGDLPPRAMTALLVMVSAATIVFGPIGRLGRLVISPVAALYFSWWLLSVVWTDNYWLFERETFAQLPLVISLSLMATILPLEDFKRALVIACYCGIAWSSIYTALNPGETTIHPDGNSGWHGAFGHKNLMGPFMLFAIATLLTLDRRPLARWAFTAVAAFFLVMSQSTTSLVVGAGLVALWFFLRHLVTTPPERRGALLAAASIVGVSSVAIGVVYLPTLTSALGKDPTLTARTQIWEGVVWAISERPITGYGAGGAWINTAADPARTILQDLGFAVAHAHNGYLEVAFQLGLVGLTLFMMLLIAQVRASLRLIPSNAELASYFLLFAGLVTLVSVSETATFGIWLALLCAFHALAIREGARPPTPR